MLFRSFQLFLQGCSTCGLMRLELDALDKLAHDRGVVLVANHPSMIDVFLVVSRLPQVICLMKASLMGNAFLAAGAYLAGYIPNRVVDTMVRDAARAVADGQSLLIFPEGTRTTEHPINALKPGAALIAKRAKAPLQLIVLETNSRYLTKEIGRAHV